MVVKKLLIGGIEYTYRYDAQASRMYVTGGEQGEQSFAVTDVRFEPANNIFFFSVDGQPQRVFVDVQSVTAAQVFLHQQSQPITVAVAQPASLGVPAKKAVAVRTEIKSPLSGRVVRIVVQPGQAVRSGQPLLFIESMKMENEICAPNDAIIKTIFIVEGNVVQPNQLLIEFEKEKEGDVDAGRQIKHEQKAV